MAYQSFEDLVVWKRSCQLAVNVYELLKDSRDYSLRNQMQRASVSIASNSAEGSERGGKDFARFLRIALGSSTELRTQAYIASRVGLIPASKCTEFVQELKQLSKMLTALRKSIRPPNSQNGKLKTENRTPKTEN